MEITEASPLRVLLVHSRYDPRLPSGENDLFDKLSAGLRAEGIDVESVSISGSGRFADIPRLAASLLFGFSGVGLVRTRIREFSPDVVHFINLFPRIAPRAIRLANKSGSKTIVSVNNYRLACLNGLFLYEGSPCERCARTRWSLPGIKRRCYRNSYWVSFLAATHRLRMLRKANRAHLYVANSEFVRDKIEGQVSGTNVVVRRNYLAPSVQQQVSANKKSKLGNRFLFVGRLSREKGALELCEAFRGVDDRSASLLIAGDGPLRGAVEQLAASDKRIQVLGSVTKSTVTELMRDASVVVVPSTCYEAGETLVAHEALSVSVPVLVRAGTSPARWLESFPEVIFDDSIDGLTEVLQRWAKLDGKNDLGTALGDFYARSYQPLSGSLIRVYSKLLSQQQIDVLPAPY